MKIPLDGIPSGYKRCECEPTCDRMFKLIPSRFIRFAWGHGCLSNIINKRCCKCKKRFYVNKFHKSKHSSDGYSERCKICVAEYQRKNPQVFRRSSRKLRLKNPKKFWARSVILSHKRKGVIATFSANELTNFVIDKHTCSVCGKELNWDFQFETSPSHPNLKKENVWAQRLASPSLDRKNGDKFMTLENIQLMCYQCNVGKASGTLEEYIQNCRNVAARHPVMK